MNTIQIDFPSDEMKNIISETISAEFEKRFPKESKLVPRIEAAKRLGISLVTFDTRAKEGVFKTQKIGGKVFINEDELTKIINGSRYE